MPHEGSRATAYGVIALTVWPLMKPIAHASPADPLGRGNDAFAQREEFILREDRIFL